uniref:Hikeshi-like domain-containing protein n=1 Tax=Oxyrrhis marina TaxID=2969 RepID=A0A7S3UHH5_OXYMA
MNTPPTSAPGPMFGLAIPGRPLITEFVQETPTSWHVDVPNPGSVSSFSVFLLRPVPSDTVGLGIYYTATTDGATFVGALSNARPTDIFSPGWPLNPDIANMPAVRIGLAFEPSESLLPKMSTVGESVDFKREFARKIALNLFRYIESFNTNGGGDARFMRCPQDLLDRWLQRFDDKYSKDPMFVFKTT